MSVWNSFETFIRSGFNGTLMLAKGVQLPFYEFGKSWDDYQTRLTRYQQNEFYYANAQYDEINALGHTLRQSGRLYLNTRSIFNPVFRLVNLYADKVYPSIIDFEKLDVGALPIIADEKKKTALKRLLRWSDWDAGKHLYVRTGEKLGDVFLRVVDDVEHQRVSLEVLPPNKVQYMRKNAGGEIEEIWITYRKAKTNPVFGKEYDSTPDTVSVTEVITETSVTIYHDNERVDGWDNPFGFVPVTHAKSTDEGFTYGMARWTVSKSKIDEINSQASLLNDQTRKSVIPYIATIGGSIDAKELERRRDKMDEIINISVGLGGDVKTVTPEIDIEGALRNIENQISELREDNPELFLHQLTEFKAPVSGVAVRQFFDLAVTKITGAMGVYDTAFTRACQMALVVGSYGNYKDFKGFTSEQYRNGDLEFILKPREVMSDAIPEATRISFMMASGAPQVAIWEALGIPDEERDEWKVALEEQNDEMVNAAIDSINNMGGTNNVRKLSTQGVTDGSKTSSSSLSTPSGA